jgi:DHA2 family multidrug resistance protein
VLSQELTRQSTMLGFIAAFVFITLSFLALIPFVLLLKGNRAAIARL